jgi:glycosyltransferase involved in cell wall biosynthesis
VLDLINTDKSAKELLEHRVTQVNATGRFANAILCGPGEYVDQLRARGLTVHVVDSPRGLSPAAVLRSIWRTFRLLRRERFDVVHTHGTVIGVIGRVAAWLARTPVVVHQVHGFHHHANMKATGRWMSIRVERVMAWLTDELLFQNPADIETCVASRIAPRRKLTLIGNGIQLDAYGNGTLPSNEPPIVLAVARFEPVKNHAMLLEAARRLKERGVVFVLQLAGDGETRSACEAQVREQGLTDVVRFLGYRDDIPALTAGADVCVLTSIKEGMPRAILEAAASGRPMVATDVVGNADALADGVAGYLVPLGDASALADRIAELLADPEKRRTIGRQARAHAEAHFDERTTTERIIEVYDRAGSRRRG